jgi:prepilin peptidase CpaA
MSTPLSDVAWLPLSVVFLASLAATFTDLRSFKIYNVLTVPLLLSGLVYHVWLDGLGGLRDSGTGVVVGFAVLILPYLAGAIGAGDVKLLMGFGAWLGVIPTAFIALAGCLLTGLFAAIVLLHRGGLQALWLNAQLSWLRVNTIGRHLFAENESGSVPELVADPRQRRNLIPFSVMLVAGLVIVLTLSALLQKG